MLDGNVRANAYTVAGSVAGVEAPAEVMSVIRAALASEACEKDASSGLRVCARLEGSAWEVRSSKGTRALLDARSIPLQVAGAAISMLARDAANTLSLLTQRACVLEYGGVGLAIVGSDWESGVVLGAHLHTRGWRYVSADHAIYDPGTGECFGFAKALYVNSSSIGAMPARYRPAIEASPWCVSPHGISFFAVDPKHAITDHSPWKRGARISAILVVDGRQDVLPSVEVLSEAHLRDRRLLRGFGRKRSVAVAELTLGPPVETCDLVERWLDCAHPVAS
jgi:hypothetical protein